MVAQPSREQPEPLKMDEKLFLAFGAKNKMASVGSSHNGCATIGISLPSQRNMPNDVSQYATVREVEAELYQNTPNLEISFNINRYVTLQTVALRWPIFKQTLTLYLYNNSCTVG
jgi:hypothetical protein